MASATHRNPLIRGKAAAAVYRCVKIFGENRRIIASLTPRDLDRLIKVTAQFCQVGSVGR